MYVEYNRIKVWNAFCLCLTPRGKVALLLLLAHDFVDECMAKNLAYNIIVFAHLLLIIYFFYKSKQKVHVAYIIETLDLWG